MHGEQEIVQDPKQGQGRGREDSVFTLPRAPGLPLRLELELMALSEGTAASLPRWMLRDTFLPGKSSGEGAVSHCRSPQRLGGQISIWGTSRQP